MMIQRFAAVTLAAALGTAAHSTEFNKDALKTMQQQGHDIVEESEGARQFRAQGDFCLDASDNGLVVKACSDAASQKWRINDQSHLVASSGQCVAGASLVDCAAGNPQSWTHDDAKRLVNAAGQCLQVQGNAPRAGANVITAPCGNATVQVWQ